MKVNKTRLNLEQLETRVVLSAVGPAHAMEFTHTKDVPAVKVRPAETLSLNFAKVVYSMNHGDLSLLIRLPRHLN